MKNSTSKQKKRGKSFLLAAIVLMVLCLSQPALSQVGMIGSWEPGTSHTKAAGTDRALIFIAHEESASGNPTLTSVTYGGQTMTKVIEISAIGSSYGNYIAAFILDEAGVADANSGTFTPTWNGTTSTVAYASVFLEHVEQTDPVGASDSAGTTSGTPNPITTDPLATNAGDMVIVGATCGNNGSYTLNNGFTEGTDQSVGSAGLTGVTGHKSATGAAETPSATYNTGPNRQVIIGFVVRAVPPDPNKATNPNPSNGEKYVSISTDLSWDAPTGFIPTSYDVYLGTDPNAHNNPKHTVDTNSYDPPGDLKYGTAYYWVVDSNDDGTIYPGGPWSFTTIVSPRPGDRAAYYIISLPLTNYYATVCSFYGVLIFSEVIGDTELKDGTIAAYEPYYTGQQTPDEGHVDDNVFGILPFELYRQTGDTNYLTVAQYLADEEFNPPRPDGLSEYSRFWVDDLYMIGSLQAQAYKSTADPNYADRAVTQLLGYMGEVEQLQQSNGLFHHTLSAPFFWGRGNGWAAAAMTEVLLSIPEDHPDRAQLLTKYQDMMAGLVTYQDTSGMWYQVLDMGSDPDNWLESSCTGMFVFALATGVKNGWLPENPYKQAAWDGWLALGDYVDSIGQVHEVCTGTGAGGNVQYYFDRPREVGNHHGQAAVIWAAKAMEQLKLKADINVDGKVDYNDLDLLSDNWLTNNPSTDIAPSQQPDGITNFLDFALFAQHWMHASY